jgi:hypothetical protein
MKNFLKGSAVTFALVGILAATSAQAGLFSSWATGDWPTEESNAFKVEAYGFDFRVYEWVSPTNPNITCSAGFIESGPIGYQCFPTVTPDAEVE